MGKREHKNGTLLTPKSMRSSGLEVDDLGLEEKIVVQSSLRVDGVCWAVDESESEG